MKPMRMKGATVFDQLCHNVFSGRCGQELWTYYCEDRLSLVECPQCRVKALVEARNPKEAAYMSLGGVKEG